MALFQAFNISASGMTAERFRTDIIAENVANVNTTRTEDGTPYRRKIVTFAEKDTPAFGDFLSRARVYGGNGVKVTKVLEDNESDYIMDYDPSHPDADENGYVMKPNVDPVKETIDGMSATRSYEANITAFNAMKLMAQKALEIGK